jgi:hypothetical protein
VEIRAEKSAVGENDAIATHAQLLAEKRFGLFALTFGLTMYLAGLALSSPEGMGPMSALAAGVVAAGLIAALLWTRIVGGRVRDQAARAEKNSDGKGSPSSNLYSGEGMAGSLAFGQPEDGHVVVDGFVVARLDHLGSIVHIAPACSSPPCCASSGHSRRWKWRWSSGYATLGCSPSCLEDVFSEVRRRALSALEKPLQEQQRGRRRRNSGQPDHSKPGYPSRGVGQRLAPRPLTVLKHLEARTRLREWLGLAAEVDLKAPLPVGVDEVLSPLLEGVPTGGLLARRGHF